MELKNTPNAFMKSKFITLEFVNHDSRCLIVFRLHNRSIPSMTLQASSNESMGRVFNIKRQGSPQITLVTAFQTNNFIASPLMAALLLVRIAAIIKTDITYRARFGTGPDNQLQFERRGRNSGTKCLIPLSFRSRGSALWHC